jgi:hypothetical protein
VPNTAPDRVSVVDIGCDLPYDNRSIGIGCDLPYDNRGCVAGCMLVLTGGRTVAVLILERQTKLTEAGDGTVSQSLDLEATFNGMARFAGVVVHLGT